MRAGRSWKLRPSSLLRSPETSDDLLLLVMSLWMILPISLPVFTITGIWVVYAMALYNQHVCPVQNWLYNESCEEPLPLQRSPVLCCTLDNVPLISKCGTLPPESCFFSLVCSTGSFMVMLVGLLRYAHVIEKHHNCVLNTAGLSTGWICAAGLIMVGNFQVDFAKFWMGHLRVSITLMALIALVLSGVFFCQESFSLQHTSAIFEWIYCMFIMVFYGTFAFEFRGMSGDTLMVLSRGGPGSFSSAEQKAEAAGGAGHPQTDNLTIL
ncbi:hypothetical protein OJAV_G00194000 [Oryzias javanicus]|uniref:CWH43-like N-terminal domain-containing protein n=1 Tax=Oryzias javanicus TaxID=123683 RepID=A0A3S2NYW9_ORYJA|nr:hypothetical protein OJAV_G00194000 [Oryzias javanicus]